MHPEFWLVLLRVFRVPLTAVLATLPLTVIAAQLGPSDATGNLMAGLIIGLLAAFPAMPALALDPMADESQPRSRRVVAWLYLLFGVPLSVILVAAALVFASGGARSVSQFLSQALHEPGDITVIFHLYIATPLIADRLNHHFTTTPVTRALPWGLLAGGYVFLSLSLLTGLKIFHPRDLYPREPAMRAGMALFVCAWPLGLALARRALGALIERAGCL